MRPSDLPTLEDYQGRPAIFQFADHHVLGEGAAQGPDGIVKVTQGLVHQTSFPMV